MLCNNVLSKAISPSTRFRGGVGSYLASLVCLSFCLCLSGTAELVAQTTLNPGDILLVDRNAFGGSGGIIRVDPVTGVQTIVSSGGSFAFPEGIVIDADGDLLVADQSAFGGAIIRVDPATGAQTTVSSGGSFVRPTGIAIDANGDLLVADIDAFGSLGGIIRVDPVTGAQTTVSSGGRFVTPTDIAIDANGDLLVVDTRGSTFTGEIVRVDPVSGAQTTVSVGGIFVSPVGIAIDANGDLLIADSNAFGGGGGIIRVDPITGAQTMVSSAGNFVNPVGIAIDANGDLLVADANAFGGGGAIIRVDPITGIQTTVSSGGSFVLPFGIAVVPSCPCDLFTATDFLSPMGKKKKLGSTLPVKFQLFFDGIEIQGQEELDALLEANGCAPACPEIQVFDVSGAVAVDLPEDPEDNVGEGGDLGVCFRYSDGNWIYNLRLDADSGFQSGGDYSVKVKLADCVLTPGNEFFQVK